MKLVLATSILTICGGFVAAGTRTDPLISISNPKKPSIDSLVVTVSTSPIGKTRNYVWKPQSITPPPQEKVKTIWRVAGQAYVVPEPPDYSQEKGSKLIWHEAYVIPGRSAFLLLKHVLEYEDDSVFPSIHEIGGRIINLKTDGIFASSGINSYLSQNGKCLHFRTPPIPHSAMYGQEDTDEWARRCYDTSSGKLIKKTEKTVTTDLKNYIRLDRPK